MYDAIGVIPIGVIAIGVIGIGVIVYSFIFFLHCHIFFKIKVVELSHRILVLKLNGIPLNTSMCKILD